MMWSFALWIDAIASIAFLAGAFGLSREAYRRNSQDSDKQPEMTIRYPISDRHLNWSASLDVIGMNIADSNM